MGRPAGQVLTKLKEYREKNFMTQKELYDLAFGGNYHSEFISSLENGKRKAGLKTIKRLADAFKIEPQELI